MTHTGRPTNRGTFLIAVGLTMLTMVASTSSMASGHVVGGRSDPHARVSAPYPPTFTVAFEATGLETSFNWTVTLATTTLSSNTSLTIAFDAVKNGTYQFVVSARGEVPAPAFGSLTVSGGDLLENITFGPSSVSNPPTNPSLPVAEVVGIIATIVVGVVVTVAFLALRARNRGGPHR